MRKSFISSLLLVLCCLLPVACSDDKAAIDISRPNYSYTVTLPSTDTERQLVIDSITGSFSVISSDVSWISAELTGYDSENHPIVKLVLDEGNDEDRLGHIYLQSEASQVVQLAVYQIGRNNSAEDRRPWGVSENRLFYKNWFEGNEGTVYVSNNQDKTTWGNIGLPWIEGVQGSIPADIIYDMRTTKDQWRLAYSTLGLEETPGNNLFILHNKVRSILRVFYWIPPGKSNEATSAIFRLNYYSPKKLTSYLLSSNLRHSIDSNSKDAASDANNYYFTPMGTEAIPMSTGWCCFDILISNAYKDAKIEALEDSLTRLSLTLLTHDVSVINLDIDLDKTGTIDMSNVKKKIKQGSGDGGTIALTSITNLFYNTGVVLTTTEDLKAGIFRMVGVGFNLLSDIFKGISGTKDKWAKFEGQAKLNSIIQGTAQGSKTYATRNQIGTISFYAEGLKYDWSTILDKNPKKWNDIKSSRAGEQEETPSFGVITFSQAPVVYVSADRLFCFQNDNLLYKMSSDGKYISLINNTDEGLRYASFLDPSSIEVFINKDRMGFDFDKVELTVNTFVLMGNGAYYQGEDSYYTKYGLSNSNLRITSSTNTMRSVFKDTEKSMQLVVCSNEELQGIKEEEATETYPKPFKYAITSLPCYDDPDADMEFSYRFYSLTNYLGNSTMLVDPVVYVPTNSPESGERRYFYNNGKLGPLMVSVTAYFYKGDDRQFASATFLPEIRTFKADEIASIRSKIASKVPATIEIPSGSFPATFTDIEDQQKKALYILDKISE